MGKPKKFGTFAGVFTPSLLTILGVIMYLRLGWVVGEAGLISTLVIIFIAHIISVTTGLSISSVATDKKIKTGGIYYILSRSLGLPMGGAIGLALFVATALSISLYLIGFAESFLSVPEIADFLNLQQDQFGIQVVGSVTMLLLVIIAFISTSLALKTQFFILAAIGLSLISVVVGLITKTEFHPQSVNLFSSGNGVPIEYIFGVFFPAVTGFTAGVAMSGDLKDSKKSIPFGTLGAIVTGLVVYVGLAIALAYFVDRDLLINDSNFLMKIAWFSPLVLAGIWGATLSSALGGILGGPRIMQAISQDKIGPRLLGKGYGENNEPRNALILVFVIAESGILLGDLNLVAGLVSMFYITAYMFINLAFALEQWASSDFRPDFKISKWFGIVGFVASFAVMFKLDTVSMFASIVIVMAIYFILKKKELQLDFGDVWQSVWSSIIRMSLHKMDAKKLEERNWRPNILMFSGSHGNRDSFIDFGKSLVGKHGFLSIFDLEKKDDKSSELKKQDQAIANDITKENQGIFNRREKVHDLYEGIELVSRTYGFSGVEPNTIFLRWGRHTKSPDRFVKMINYISTLDHNLLMMDFDQERKFGDRKRIDIWWRGISNNGNLALQLVKFLWLSDEWREAQLRLMIINPVNDEKELIYRNASSVLESLRMNAEIKVINNQIEKKSPFDIIHLESKHSSLTFMGIPSVIEGNESDFINNVNTLCQDIGTVILVKASSRFKELNIGVREGVSFDKKLEKLQPVIEEDLGIADFDFPDDPVLASNVESVWKEYADLVVLASGDYYQKLFSHQQSLVGELKEQYEAVFNKIPKKVLKRYDYHLLMNQFVNEFISASRKILESYKSKTTELQYDVLNNAIQFIRDESMRIQSQLSPHLTLHYPKELFEVQTDDNFNLRMFKLRGSFHFLFSKKDYHYHLKYKRLIKNVITSSENRILYELLNKWGQINVQFVIELQKQLLNISRTFMEISNAASNAKAYQQCKKDTYSAVGADFEKILTLNEESLTALTSLHLKKLSEDFVEINTKLKILNVNQTVIPFRDSVIRKEYETVNLIPDLWKENQTLLFNQALLELNLQAYTTKVVEILKDASKGLKQVIDDRIADDMIHLEDYLKTYISEAKQGTINGFDFDVRGHNRQDVRVAFESVVDEAFRKIRLAGNVFPENVTLLEEASYDDFYTQQFNNPPTIDVRVLRLIDYIIQSEFIGPVEKVLSDIALGIKKNVSMTGDICRIISYSIGHNELDKQDASSDENMFIVQLMEEQYAILKDGISLVDSYKTTIDEKIDERIEASYDLLSTNAIIKNVSKLNQYIKDHKNTERWVRLKSLVDSNYKMVEKQMKSVWYRQSKGVLLANRLRRQENYSQTRIHDILNIFDQVSVDKNVLKDVPFYYQQLFLRKEYYLNEFWVGRDKELKEFELTCNRYQNGFKGAIMVLGERGCGKSFFTQYAIQKYLPDADLYTVTAPFAGSSDPDDFKKTLQTVFSDENYEAVLDHLDSNTVVVFDGVEQWWEKSKDGFVVIEQIMDLINRYNSKILFVLNANIHSFNVMNSVRRIESFFLNMIELDAFNAEEIKEIIMLRHKSGNLRFELSNRPKKKMMAWDNARLFSKYFNYSKGNVGVVLDAWIANIEYVDGETLYVRNPKLPDINNLNHLENEWWLLLVQFVLHKRIHLRRLVAITMQSEDDLLCKLQILKRAGVINETSSDVYEINRFLYPHFRAKMKEKDIL